MSETGRFLTPSGDPASTQCIPDVLPVFLPAFFPPISKRLTLYLRVLTDDGTQTEKKQWRELRTFNAAAEGTSLRRHVLLFVRRSCVDRRGPGLQALFILTQRNVRRSGNASLKRVRIGEFVPTLQ